MPMKLIAASFYQVQKTSRKFGTCMMLYLAALLAPIVLTVPALAATAPTDQIVSVPFTIHNNALVIHGAGDVQGEIPPAQTKSVQGVVGKGIAFDGEENQSITISGEPLLKIRKELTISLWVKPTAYDRSRYQTVVSRGWNWELRLTTGGIRIRFLGNPHPKFKSILLSTSEVPPGKWTYIAYTFSLSQHTTALYVNGKLVEKATDIDFPLWDMGQKKLLLGMSPGNYNLYHGAVDELRVYDRALSLDEVEALYSQEGKSTFHAYATELEKYLRQMHHEINKNSTDTLTNKYQIAKEALKQLNEKGSAETYRTAQLAMEELATAAYYSKIAELSGDQGIKRAISFVVRPFGSQRILPKTQIDPSELSGSISLQGSPSETLTASFVLRPTSNDVQELMITPRTLQSTKGISTIPSSAMDVRVVKVWYQAASAWNSIHFDSKQGDNDLKPVLVPELLLHDASLVKVDYEKKRNYLKLTDANGYHYSDISKRKQPEVSHDQYTHQFINIPVDKFPVADDAKTLQSLSIKENVNQQFWVNLKLPEDAVPGYYQGKLEIISDSGVNGSIALSVRVLPINLTSPMTHYDPEQRFFHSVYYRGKLSPDGRGYIGSEYKSKVQFEAEMRNMRDHEIDFVSNRSPLSELKNLNTSLAIQHRILGGNILFNTGTGYNLGIGLNTDADSFATLKKRAKLLKAIASKHGYDIIYTYGVDELAADKVEKEKAIWQQLHTLGIKVYVSGKKDIVKRFADILDILVSNGSLDKSAAQQMHQHGHRILSYANPFAGPENPKPFRTNYGIKLWKHNYDSAMTYEYQSAFAVAWNDFDNHKNNYRDIAFTYPTTHSVIDTIAWEGYAQGKRDVNYASRLMQLVRKWNVSDNAAKKQTAKDADNYMKQLTIGLNTDLDQVRAKIIQYIMKLNSESGVRSRK